MSWLRLGSIAVAAILLASCRSVDVAHEAARHLTGVSRARFDGSSAPSRGGYASETSHAAHQACQADDVCVARAACEVPFSLPEPPVPVVGGCLICDGGDHGKPASAAGDGIVNLTAGDTVARYRGENDLEHQTQIAVSDCVCVFSPRFASVREVIRPHEDSVIAAAGRVTTDDAVETDTGLAPVKSDRRRIGPTTTRQKMVGIGLQTRDQPLEVAEELLPSEAESGEQPVIHVAANGAELAEVVRRPHHMIGFDVPYAWTCLQQAQVMIDEQPAAVVSSEQNTATLRVEEQGRAELTLSKCAGSTTAKVGEELDFTIVFLNSGDTPLVDVVLVDALPARLQLVAGSADATVPASFSTAPADDGSTVLSWRLERTLEPGHEGYVRFRTVVH